MKFILLAGVFLILSIYAHQTPDHYDILLDSIGNHSVGTVPGMDSYTALKFSETEPVSVPIKDIPLSNAKISSPFILNTIFKVQKVKSSYIFLIDDNANNIQLGMDLTPVGATSTRVTFFLNGLNVETIIHEELKDEWTKLMIVVDEDVLTFYKDCEQHDDVTIDNFEYLKFNEDAKLHLAYGGAVRKGFFEGVIQEIKLYPNTDLIKKDIICSKDIQLPDSNTNGNDWNRAKNNGTQLVENLIRDDFMAHLLPPPSPPPPPILIGDKGEKGDPGESIRGPQGIPGENGQCECSIDTVSKLLESMPSMRGLKGETGVPGEDGKEGPVGQTGKHGMQGERGQQELKGDKGDIGNPGPEGMRGLKGEPGQDGLIGPQGPIGSPGPPGPPGPPGNAYKEIDGAEVSKRVEKGEVGSIGPPGLKGDRGYEGEKGEKGMQGMKGEKGDQGFTGIQGPIGMKGERGEPGLDGVPGSPGAHGRSAKNGEKGERGDKGDRGDPGKAAYLTDVLKADINSEEGFAIIEKLRGVKGDVGAKGERGDKGSPGISGAPGFPGNIGLPGPDGKRGHRGHPGAEGPSGPRGLKGEPGEPCISVNKGMTTTLVKGPQGEAGIPGKTGPRGPRGYTGSKGVKGSQGQMGNIGLMGPEGRPGVPGPKGEKGESGVIDPRKIKGLKGDIGPKGEIGLPGPIGPPGNTVCCNITKHVPVPGPPGPPGIPGLSITGPKGEPGGILSRKTFVAFNHFKPDGFKENNDVDEDDWSTATTMIFQSTTALIKRTSDSPLGTLAYIVREQSLLLRVNRGWQYVTMGSFLESETATILQVPAPIDTPRVSQSEKIVLPDRYLRIAALNTPFTGKMLHYQSAGSAVTECRRESRKMLDADTTFVPFLATTIQDLKSIVYEPDRTLPVVNIHGQIIFDSWLSMFNGSEAAFANHINIYSFSGKNIFIDSTWPNKAVWHGGTIYGHRSTNICNDWQSDATNFTGTATSLHHKKLLSEEKYTCDNKFIVLCIEVHSPSSVEKRQYKSTRRRYHTRTRSRIRYNLNNDLN